MNSNAPATILFKNPDVENPDVEVVVSKPTRELIELAAVLLGIWYGSDAHFPEYQIYQKHTMVGEGGG